MIGGAVADATSNVWAASTVVSAQIVRKSWRSPSRLGSFGCRLLDQYFSTRYASIPASALPPTPSSLVGRVTATVRLVLDARNLENDSALKKDAIQAG